MHIFNHSKSYLCLGLLTSIYWLINWLINNCMCIGCEWQMGRAGEWRDDDSVHAIAPARDRWIDRFGSDSIQPTTTADWGLFCLSRRWCCLQGTYVWGLFESHTYISLVHVVCIIIMINVIYVKFRGQWRTVRCRWVSRRIKNGDRKWGMFVILMASLWEWAATYKHQNRGNGLECNIVKIMKNVIKVVLSWWHFYNN